MCSAGLAANHNAQGNSAATAASSSIAHGSYTKPHRHLHHLLATHCLMQVNKARVSTIFVCRMEHCSWIQGCLLFVFILMIDWLDMIAGE